jgi:superfamily II DNA helicase RecQ
MAYRVFVVPVRDEGPAASELNGFLRSRRVLSVDRRWVEQGTESFWSFCVDYLESGGGGPSPAAAGKNGALRGKVDYREILSPEDFAVFARLRQVRQEIAQGDAVPVYTIFTNEQLAQMVRGRATTRAALEKIAGVGDARIEKYGARVLGILKNQWDGSGTDAAGQPPL